MFLDFLKEYQIPNHKRNKQSNETRKCKQKIESSTKGNEQLNSKQIKTLSKAKQRNSLNSRLGKNWKPRETRDSHVHHLRHEPTTVNLFPRFG